MSKEIWKAIEGYEGLYEVSDRGRVRSLTRTIEQRAREGSTSTHTYRGRILTNGHNIKGYCHIVLHNGDGGTTFRVSRLVAQHFIPNPENKPQVNHLDGNLDNNVATNLEWATNIENQRHSWRELNRQQSGAEKRPVIAERKGEFRYWSSINEPAKYGIGASQVANTLAGRQNTCHGFHWRYASPDEIQFFKRFA